jgi:hypothetical protein
MILRCVAVCRVYEQCIFESVAGESMASTTKRRPQKTDRASWGEAETVIIVKNNGKGLSLRSLRSETPTPDRDMLPSCIANGIDLSANCLHNCGH